MPRTGFLALIIAVVLGPYAAEASTGRTFTLDINEAADRPAVERTEDPLEVHFTPGVMFTRLVGEGKFTADGTEMFFDDRFGLSRVEAIPNAEVTIRRDQRVDLTFGGTHFSTSASGNFEGAARFGELRFRDGDAFRSKLSLTNAFVEVGYTFRPLLRNPDNIRDDGRPIADLRLTPSLGARYVDIDHSVERVGDGRVDTGGEWFGLYGSVKAELLYRPEPQRIPMLHMLQLDAGIGAGRSLGTDPAFMWQVRSGVTWHVTEHLGVQFGYRLMDLHATRGDYRFTGGLQGIFLAASLRF